MATDRGRTQRSAPEGEPGPSALGPEADVDELVTDHGHDRHFLSRLERVTWRETDLALRLYHEPALVRALLADSSVPRAAERIALAIAPGEGPAHVLVTRQGRFITCLGPGMRVGELPVLSWERLVMHVERADRDSARIERAIDTLTTEGGQPLVRRLTESGARLTREHFQRLVAVEPLLHHKLLSEIIEMAVLVSKARPGIARIKRPHTEVPRLRYHWNAMHYLGHLLLLTSHDGRRSFDFLELGRDKPDLFEHLYVPLLEFGYGPLALRALWAIGRAGKLALPSLKRMLQRPQQRFIDWCFAALGLVSIAMRHQRLRAEALGAIHITHLPQWIREDRTAVGFVDTIHRMAGNAELCGAKGPVWRQEAARRLAGTLVDALAGRPRRSAEVLREDALTITRFAQLPFDYVVNTGHMHTLIAATLVLAARPAEEFYFPAEHVEEAPAFTPEAACALAESARPEGPVKAEAKPGRNDPCSCGSGKKYKKCCG